MQIRPKAFFIALVFSFQAVGYVAGQGSGLTAFLTPADTFDKGRFWMTAGAGAAIYTASSIGLWKAWYKDQALSGFHTFDDLGEWHQMDKAGHLFTTYTESRYAFQGARWTGLSHPKAVWTGFAVGNFLQLTLETMDGFSEKWGFSWSDLGFNLLGSGMFASQEFLWRDQRIKLKVSSDFYQKYPDDEAIAFNTGAAYPLAERGEDLYGKGFAATFLKDYNRMNIWVSANIYSFLPERAKKGFPKWLNLAAGYSSENLYGGFHNAWENGNDRYLLDGQLFPRYRQYYLSVDVDLSRIETGSRLFDTILDVVNWLKIPAPALEINSLGKVRVHAFR